MAKLVMVFVCVLALAGALWAADCSAKSYRQSCASCSFDSGGKMDESCYNSYKAQGVACNTAAFPVTSSKYAAGKCPEVGACTEELSACKAQYESGNDKADCQEGSVSVCFAAADSCMLGAARKCEGIESPCGGATSALVLLVSLVVALPVLYARFK